MDRARIAASCLLVALVATVSVAQTATELPGPLDLEFSATILPTAWRLTPTGDQLEIVDTALGLAADRDGKFVAALTSGQRPHTLYLIDPATWECVDQLDLGRTFLGLAFSEDGNTIYASGGRTNLVYVVSHANGKLAKVADIRIRPQGEPGFIGAVHCAGDRLYVLELDGNQLDVVDLPSREIISRVPVEGRPYDLALSPDGQRAYISRWGRARIAVVDLPAGNIIADILTGPHPNDVDISPDGRWLYIACAEANAVDIIDTSSLKVVARAGCSLLPGRGIGSTTNGLTLDAAHGRLYAANADNNCVAVLDVTEPKQAQTIGFIPVGWYPTASLVAPDGQTLYVANAKGINAARPRGVGTISRIQLGDALDLEVLTRRAYENRPDSPRRAEQLVRPADTVIPSRTGTADNCPIKHVIYIVKENQTYDSYFGDIPEGNGDPSLCLWPEQVSPNHHALAREFVLLDNFYNNGEVSMDGHPWCDYAYCTDAVEKSWPAHYGGKGPTLDIGSLAIPSSDALWTLCARYGISYRCYAEGPPMQNMGFPFAPGDYDPNYPGWLDMEKEGGEIRNAQAFLRDLDEHIQRDQVPRLMIVGLPKDHTAFNAPGYQTMRAMVAEHDLALGMIVEAVSQSPIWPETAIFIVEDDTQNSSDHVDYHRGPCLVISPWARRQYHDATMYNNCSVLRTIELILGLPPMTQHDATALPMWKCFTNQPDFTPYTLQEARYDLQELNPSRASGDSPALALDFSSYQALRRSKAALGPDHDRLLRELTWQILHGPNSPCPPLVRAAFVLPLDEVD